jgi:flagellar basal-body rod modification protein FlgD
MTGSITNTPASAPVSQGLLNAMNPAPASATDTATATQDRFMKLLVTQMKNQDPLNPMDNAQVTSQMAQLSTVSGIDKLNATLQSLMGSYQSSQSLQATSMIGHGVLVPGSSVALSGSKAILGMDLAGSADSVQVTITDASGKQVQKINVGASDAGVQPLAWDGAMDSGAVAPDGNYTFAVTATRGGQAVGATALSFAQVASVSTGSAGVKLNLPGRGSVALTDVRQIM